MNLVFSRPVHITICRTVLCGLFLLIPFLPHSHAADSEPELFVRGYEYILSLDAHHAAGIFRQFLQEFPQSSARDAAMFWLGRALVSLKSYAEAEQLFRAIPREFPESPYLRFIDVELDEIARLRSSPPAKEPVSVPQPAAAAVKREGGQRDYEKEMALAREESREARALLEEEKKARAGLQTRLSELETKEGLLNRQIAETESTKRELSAGETTLRAERSEKVKLSSEVEILQAENSVLQARVQEAERKTEQGVLGMNLLNSYLARCLANSDGLTQDLVALPSPELENLWTELTTETPEAPPAAAAAHVEPDLKQPEPAAEQPSGPKTQPAPQVTESTQAPAAAAPAPPFVIRGKSYSRAEVSSALAASERTLSKLGIKEPVWRRGDPDQDFIDEHLLVEAAGSSGVRIDERKYLDSADRFQLSSEEAAYLRTFMMISGLIGSIFDDRSPDLFIDILAVDYTGKGAARKAERAAELQDAARSGKSFEEIGRQHGDFVKFSRLRIEEFATVHKDKRQVIDKLNFQSGEPVVIWSDKGYMLIRPVALQRPFDPFTEPDQEDRERIRTYLSGYVAELRKVR